MYSLFNDIKWSKANRVVSIFQISIFSALLFKLLKLPGTFFNSKISNLYSSDFKLANSFYLAEADVSTSAAFFKSF